MKKDESPKVRLSIYLSEKTKEKIDKIAKKYFEGNVSALVRKACLKYTERKVRDE